MDPVPVSPPEIILNDRGDPDCFQPGPLSFSRLPPHHHQPFSADRYASQELDTCELSGGRVGRPSPSEARRARMDDSASPGASADAEMRRRRTDSDQITHTLSWAQRESNPNQQGLQHLLPSLMMGPIQLHIRAHENPFNSNFLPGVCPSPLNHQALIAGDRVQPELPPLLPELILAPCSFQETCWVNPSPAASLPNPGFGFSRCGLVPCGPFLPPPSWLPVPEVRPGWCLCPQTVAVRQPCGPGLLSRKAGETVSEQLNVTPKSAASGKEQSEEKAKSEEKRQKNDTQDKDKLQTNSMDNKTAKSEVSPGPPLSLDEESLAERAFEEYMTIMDSLCPKIYGDVEVKERENEGDKDAEKEKLERENSAFLEYLDELCSDEDFVRKVESALNIDYLDSLLSSDPEPLDLLALEKQEQEDKSNQLSDDSSSDPATDETSHATSRVEERAQMPILDPPGTQPDPNPKPDGQNSPLSKTKTGSKEGPLPTDATPRYFSPVSALSSLRHNGSVVMDSSLTLPLHSSPDILNSDLKAADYDTLAALFLADDSCANVSEDTSLSLPNFANTQSAQLSPKIQSGPLPGNPPASESHSTSSAAGSAEDPPAPRFRADLLIERPPQSAGPQDLRVLAWKTPPLAQIKESEVQHSPRNINPKTFCLKDMSHPPEVDLNNAIPVQASLSFVAKSHPDSYDAQVDGNSSGSAPEEQILEAPQRLQICSPEEVASPGIFYELRTGEGRDIEKKCEKNLEKGVRKSATPKKTATKEREEGVTKKTFERKVENKENDTKLVKIRRSQRLSDQNKKEKAGLSSEFQIEEAEGRKPSEKSIKKTAKFTPEKDGVIYEKQKRSSGGRQLCLREDSNFEKLSQGPKIAHTVEQFSEMGKKDQHQKLTGETQRLTVEAREQCEANDSSICTNMGEENTLSTKTPQEKGERDEGRVERQEEGIQMSSFVRTRSKTTGEKAHLTPLPDRDRRKIQYSEMERSEMKASPEREMQDQQQVNVKEYANKQSVSSQSKRSRSRRDEEESSKKANEANKTDLTACKASDDKVSGNRSPVSPPALPSLRSPRVQTKDMITVDQGGREAKLNGRDEQKHPVSSQALPSVNTCEKNQKLSPILHSESIQLSQQQSKTAALSEDGAGGHSEVVGTKTCDFYSLRSLGLTPNGSKMTVNRIGSQKSKAADRSRTPKPSQDQTADVKGEGERINVEADNPSLTLSPVKRYQQECGASEETDTRVNESAQAGIETEILKSPMKRARWKSKAEVNSRRAEDQRQTSIQKGDEGSGVRDKTFGICAPCTRSKTKAEDKIISKPSRLTEQETFEGEKNAGKTPSREESSATKTRTRLRGILVPHSPKKQTRLFRTLPSKYKDFILCKPMVKGKAGKGKILRCGKKKMDN